MDEGSIPLLKEIRDLLQRSVGNQEQVLRSNAEVMKIYKSAVRRQQIAIVLVVFVLFGVVGLMLFTYRH